MAKPPKGRRPDRDQAEAPGRAIPPPAGLPIMPRPFEIESLADGARTQVSVEANAAECEALARSYGLPAILSLCAQYDVLRRGRMLRVTGEVRARVTQICVVTLDPFDSDIVEPVEIEYAPEAMVAEAWERIAKAEASGSQAPVEDPPDPIVDGRIDLGALTAETLALALDPYPKKPGVEFEAPADPNDEPDASPFAALARLKKDIGPGGA